MNDSPHGASVVPRVAVTIAIDSVTGGHGRDERAVHRGAPVRVGQHAGHDVGQKHRRQQQQEVLDAVETAAQHQQGDDQCRRRNAQIAGDAEQLESGGDAGEFGAGGADVGDDERGQHRTAQPHAVPLPHQADETLPGDDAHPGCQAVEDHERDGGQQQHPQQLVAVIRAEYRVGGDAGRVVVGEAGEQPGADHRQQCADTQPSSQRVPRRGRWRRRGQTRDRRNRRPGTCARRRRQWVACSAGIAATICATWASGMARSTRSPTTG